MITVCGECGSIEQGTKQITEFEEVVDVCAVCEVDADEIENYNEDEFDR